jgi:hypothetical protein
MKTFQDKFLGCGTASKQLPRSPNQDTGTSWKPFSPNPPGGSGGVVLRAQGMEGISSGVRFSDWYHVIETLPLETGGQVHTHLGPPHILTTNITDPTPTSCTNMPPNHHAHLRSSHPPTSGGRNPHHQRTGHSLVTHTQHLHQASILSNSSDSAFLKHTAHYYVTLPVRSNFIPQPPHLTSTLTSLWKIHTP